MAFLFKGLYGSSYNLPYHIGKEIPAPLGERFDYWRLHEGTSTDSSSPNQEVTIFVGNFKKSSNPPDVEELAKAAVKRSKTLVLPNSTLRTIATQETSDSVYIVTEKVTPLLVAIEACPNASLELFVAWGIVSVATALAQLHALSLMHCNVGVHSVFVTSSGEWRLGLLEHVTEYPNGISPLYSYTPKIVRPPESAQVTVGTSATPIYAADAWALGCLIYELYSDLSSTPDLRNPASIPSSLRSTFMKLACNDPRVRLDPAAISVSAVVERSGTANHGGLPLVLCSPWIRFLASLDSTVLGSVAEVDRFAASLAAVLPSEGETGAAKPPKELLQLRIGGMFAQSASLFTANSLSVFLRLGTLIGPDGFEKMAGPVVVRLFSSDDPEVRVAVLTNVGQFVTLVSSKVLDTAVWPHVAECFSNQRFHGAARSAALKAIATIAPNLPEATVGNAVIRVLWSAGGGGDAGLRTNATIVTGRIASVMSRATSHRTLWSTYARALKDPFVHNRLAALSAIRATLQYLGMPSAMKSQEDDALCRAIFAANTIIPAVSCLLCAPESNVRQLATQVVTEVLDGITQYYAGLPEPDLQGDHSAAGAGTSVDPTKSPNTGGSLAWGALSTAGSLASKGLSAGFGAIARAPSDKSTKAKVPPSNPSPATNAASLSESFTSAADEPPASEPRDPLDDLFNESGGLKGDDDDFGDWEEPAARSAPSAAASRAAVSKPATVEMKDSAAPKGMQLKKKGLGGVKKNPILSKAD